MNIKSTIFIFVSLILVAFLLPAVLVVFSDIFAVIVIGGEQVRVQEADIPILILLTVLLPILIVIGLAMPFMDSRDESSICKSCIWFLRDLTCEKGYELDCRKCEGFE